MSLSERLNPSSIVYQTSGVLHLSTLRWLMLIMGAVVPELSGAMLVAKTQPIISVILLAAAFATIAYIFTFLKQQKVGIFVYQDELEFKTSRGSIQIKRKSIKDVRVQERDVIITTQEENHRLSLANPQELVQKLST